MVLNLIGESMACANRRENAGCGHAVGAVGHPWLDGTARCRPDIQEQGRRRVNQSVKLVQLSAAGADLSTGRGKMA